VGTAGNQAGAATSAAGTAGQNLILNELGTGTSGISSAAGTGAANVNTATTGANSTLTNALGAQTNNLNPYLTTGAAGTTAYQNLLAQGFQAPTAAQAAATPGEQFQMQQGAQLLQQQAAANGGVDTGGELEALTQYGQNVASTYYQNAFNNAESVYNTNLAAAQGAIGTGLTASGQFNQATQNATNQVANNTIGAATYGSNLNFQGATTNAHLEAGAGNSAAGLGLNAATTAGNQNLSGTEAASNLFMQGAQGTAAGQLGQAQGYENALGGLATAANVFGGNYFSPYSSTAGSVGGSLFGGNTNPYGYLYGGGVNQPSAPPGTVSQELGQGYSPYQVPFSAPYVNSQPYA
jgi:hypothetical protein